MKKVSLILSAVVMTAMMLSSCSVGESNEEVASNEEKPILGEIKGVYALIEYYPVDEKSSSNYGYEEIDETLYICYEAWDLVKIEILGMVNDVSIEYINYDDEKTQLINNQNINGQLIIVPNSTNNYLNGGRIVIQAENKVLKEIEIIYDGCR